MKFGLLALFCFIFGPILSRQNCLSSKQIPLPSNLLSFIWRKSSHVFIKASCLVDVDDLSTTQYHYVEDVDDLSTTKSMADRTCWHTHCPADGHARSPCLPSHLHLEATPPHWLTYQAAMPPVGVSQGPHLLAVTCVGRTHSPAAVGSPASWMQEWKKSCF